MIVFILSAAAQNRTIKGRVTDESGNPIPNATILVKGTSLGTNTDTNGDYSLSIPLKARILIFSSIGKKAEETAIGNRYEINSSLKSLVTSLEEVVVNVPYGTIKKKAFTGSETTVSASQISKQQVSTVTKALDGLIPGVIATNGGGAPGSNADLRIRGIGSINATSSPLYVVNGVPYDGSISAISPDDIESVTVLKDAAAAALYGSRAANGVIMINTKKGRAGRTNITANIAHGIQTRGIPEYDRIGTKDYYELNWESIRNSFVAAGDSYTTAGAKASAQLTDNNHLVYNSYNVPGNTLVDPLTGKLNPNAKLLWTDSWSDALFQNAPRTNANLAFSGGSDKTDYFLSLGYLDETGTLKFSDYRRYSTRINVNTKANNWLNGGLSLDGQLADSKNTPSGGTATTNPFYFTRQIGPIYPVYQYDANGSSLIDSVGGEKLDWGVPSQMGTRPYAGNSNDLGSLYLDDRSNHVINATANTYAEVHFTKDLSFKTTLATTIWDRNSTNYQNNQFGDAQNVRGRSTKTAERIVSLTLNEVLNYSKNFGPHTVRALAGHENYRYKYNNLNLTRTGFQFPGQTDLDNAALTESVGGSYEDNQRIESYFAQANYDYNQKYLLSASVRRDGSSRFADSVRWGTFYSVGAGWVVSNENFMKNVSWINNLKIRGSYGEQGNDNIGLYYQYINYYYANGVGNYSAPTRPANAGLKWETNKSLSIGTDFTLFKSRLQVTFDYFNRVSDNLLFDVPLPISTGNSSVYQNIGTMKNYGVELGLGYNLISKKDFDWRIDLNLTHFDNKITKLPPNQKVNGIVSGTKKLFEGRSIYDFWLREFAGVDASNGDALYYKDVLGANNLPTGQRVLTNDITKASYYYIKGSAIPKISGGLTNSIRFKNFSLSALATFSAGNYFYDGNYAGIMHSGSYGIAWQTDILNRWQKPGDITNVPRVQQSSITTQDGASSRFLFDGSYVNIKNITLNYRLPSEIIKRFNMADASFFVSVDNAYLFTAKKGMDPQRSFTGTSDATYPTYRITSVGIKLSL